MSIASDIITLSPHEEARAYCPCYSSADSKRARLNTSTALKHKSRCYWLDASDDSSPRSRTLSRKCVMLSFIRSPHRGESFSLLPLPFESLTRHGTRDRKASESHQCQASESHQYQASESHQLSIIQNITRLARAIKYQSFKMLQGLETCSRIY